MKLSKQTNRPMSRRLRHKTTRTRLAKILQQQIMCVSRYCLKRLLYPKAPGTHSLLTSHRLNSTASSLVTISTPYPLPSHLRQCLGQVSNVCKAPPLQFHPMSLEDDALTLGKLPRYDDQCAMII